MIQLPCHKSPLCVTHCGITLFMSFDHDLRITVYTGELFHTWLSELDICTEMLWVPAGEL